MLYREGGQIFQREGAAGEPPPLRRVIGTNLPTVAQEDVRTRESRKKLIRKVKLYFLLPFLSRCDELSLFTDFVHRKTPFSSFLPTKQRTQTV